MEGKRIRGSDTDPNFVLIDSQFYKVTPELVSFEFVKSDPGNDFIMGYSRVMKAIFVQHGKGGTWLYTPVTLVEWQARLQKPNKLGEYLYTLMQSGKGFRTKNNIVAVANEYVLDHLNKLEYYHARTCGLWATDQPDKVIDPEGVLFQIQ